VLRAPGIDRIAKSPRAFLDTLSTHVTYDARNTNELLGSLPDDVGTCPPLETYVDKLVEYVQQRMRQRHAPKKAEVEIEDPLA
jgi:hypothetical protein